MIFIPINVATNDAGIEIITIRALRILCKNNNITAATRKIASIKSWITESAASRVKSDVSFAILTFRFCLP
ncbi:hypothetical protein D3C78_1144570 [compost metagenome]